MPVGLFIKPARPTDLLAALDDVATTIKATSYRASVQTNVGAANIKGPSGQWATDPAHAAWRKLVAEPYAQCTHVDFHEQGRNDRRILLYNCTDGLRATLEIDGNISADERAPILTALTRHFTITNYADSISPTADIDGALQLRERAVSDLHAQLQQLGELLTNITIRESAERRETQQQLQETFQKKEEALAAKAEQARRELEKHAAEREARLTEKEAEHAKRVAEFETDEARRVRRKLLGDVEKVLKDLETSTTSPQTEARRKPIWIGILGLLGVFGALAATGAVQYFRTLDAHYAWPFSAGMLGFSGMAIYGLRWTDSWHRQHAAQEMMARRYKADILRASWIAELASEWSDEGRQVPTGLVDVFARNLFLDVNGPSETQHPVEQLLAKAGKIELSKGRLVIDNATGK
jgi:hypothetical protein